MSLLLVIFCYLGTLFTNINSTGASIGGEKICLCELVARYTTLYL